MNFTDIKSQITQNDPALFLQIALKQKQQPDATIIFNSTIDVQFKKNAAYLASKQTITQKDLEKWKENKFLVVAQTIDGDYIAGTTSQTLIIPVSLYKSDIEIFPLFLTDFFIAYLHRNIHSRILPPAR